jgi:hypothetical protein
MASPGTVRSLKESVIRFKGSPANRLRNGSLQAT